MCFIWVFVCTNGGLVPARHTKDEIQILYTRSQSLIISGDYPCTDVITWSSIIFFLDLDYTKNLKDLSLNIVPTYLYKALTYFAHLADN